MLYEYPGSNRGIAPFSAKPKLRLSFRRKGAKPKVENLFFNLSLPQKGGMRMVTYSELFQLCIVITGIVALVIQITKKK